MGLDMYLTGRKFLWRDYEHPDNDRKEDGFRVATIEVELGLLAQAPRPPRLHRAGVRRRQGRVPRHRAVGARPAQHHVRRGGGRLPHTEGFFFGASNGDERDCDIAIFACALAWLESGGPPARIVKEIESGPLGGLGAIGMAAFELKADAIPASRESRSVIYRASW